MPERVRRAESTSQLQSAPVSESHTTTKAISMERNIAVYSSDGALLQWIDQKRCQRLVDCGRVARVVKTRLGRVRRLTLLRMAGEWQPSFLSDYNGTQYSSGNISQMATDVTASPRLATTGMTMSITSRPTKSVRCSWLSCLIAWYRRW
jgi:hypothetical protein